MYFIVSGSAEMLGPQIVVKLRLFSEKGIGAKYVSPVVYRYLQINATHHTARLSDMMVQSIRCTNGEQFSKSKLEH